MKNSKQTKLLTSSTPQLQTNQKIQSPIHLRTNQPRQQQQQQQQQEQDPTNLYITNLPPYFKETDLEKMLSKYGHVVSTKILCDAQLNSRGNWNYALNDSNKKQTS